MNRFVHQDDRTQWIGEVVKMSRLVGDDGGGLWSIGFVHIEGDVLCEHCPDHAHHFIGQRDSRSVFATPLNELGDPAALSMIMPVRPADDGTRAVNDQGT